MAIKFKNVTGKAKKSSAESYTYNEGDNTIRMVGDILPRYVYWTTTTDNKRIPMECLAFDREQERFRIFSLPPSTTCTAYAQEHFKSLK